MPTLRTSSTTLYYAVEGNGPAILFIQGVGVAGTGWEPQVQEFRSDFRTLAFDNRGVGRSQPCHGPISLEAMAGDALAVLDAERLDAVHVVGHSMGGVIAQELALMRPQRVLSLTLMCTFFRGRDAARLTPWVLWMTLRTRLGSREKRRRAFLEMIHTAPELAGIDCAARAEELGRLFGRDLAHSPPILMKQLRALSRHNASSRLGRLAGIPTLVMSAAEDRIAPPVYGRRLAAAIPGARYEEVPGAAHGVSLAQPTVVNRLLREFIGRRSARVESGS